MLLLSYLDKIGLSLTAEAGQALAVLYSEARLYKGPRLAGLSQSATTRSTGTPLNKLQELNVLTIDQSKKKNDQSPISISSSWM